MSEAEGELLTDDGLFKRTYTGLVRNGPKI